MTKANVRSKVLNLANHWMWLGAIFLMSILIPAGIFWVVEPVTLIEAIEWSVYLITSTGLGAYKATYLVTQIVSIAQMLWGPVLLLALVTGMIVNALRVDPNAFTDAEQEEILSYVRDQRAMEGFVKFDLLPPRGTPVEDHQPRPYVVSYGEDQ